MGRHNSASYKHTWFSGKKAVGGLRWGEWVRLINLAISESSQVDCPQKKWEGHVRPLFSPTWALFLHKEQWESYQPFPESLLLFHYGSQVWQGFIWGSFIHSSPIQWSLMKHLLCYRQWTIFMEFQKTVMKRKWKQQTEVEQGHWNQRSEWKIPAKYFLPWINNLWTHTHELGNRVETTIPTSERCQKDEIIHTKQLEQSPSINQCSLSVSWFCPSSEFSFGITKFFSRDVSSLQAIIKRHLCLLRSKSMNDLTQRGWK